MELSDKRMILINIIMLMIIVKKHRSCLNFDKLFHDSCSRQKPIVKYTIVLKKKLPKSVMFCFLFIFYFLYTVINICITLW